MGRTRQPTDLCQQFLPKLLAADTPSAAVGIVIWFGLGTPTGFQARSEPPPPGRTVLGDAPFAQHPVRAQKCGPRCGLLQV